MRKKLRIFSHIAIICLSVCMFAFGVYAANQVSVTTSGTVTFNATGVYAEITGVITGMDNAPTLSTLNYASGVTPSEAELNSWKENALVFKDNKTPIVLEITITNKATDRNIVFTVEDKIADTYDKLNRSYAVSTDAYDGANYNINPAGQEGNVQTITITFDVEDANNSFTLDYNYLISLDEQAKVTANLNLPTGVTSTSVGNVNLINIPFSASQQLTTYSFTGGTGYEELEMQVVDNSVVIPLFVYNAEPITVNASVVNNDGTIQLNSCTFNNGNISISQYCGDQVALTVPVAMSNANGDVGLVRSVYFEESCYTSITLPNTLNTLPEGAFNKCYYLTTINNYKPENITNFGGKVFRECRVLEGAIELPAYVTSITDDYFENCAKIETIIAPGVDSIVFDAINGCSSLTAIKIGKPLLNCSSEGGSISGLGNLKEISLIDGAIYTEDPNAEGTISFSYIFTGLTKVDLSDNVTTITGFANCNITKLPAKLTTISEGAFWGCSGVVITELPEGVTVIPVESFRETGIVNLTLHNKVTRIESDAFKRCNSLEEIFIPASVTSIGWTIFNDCSQQISVTFGGTKAQFEAALNAGCSTTEITHLSTGLLAGSTITFSNGEVITIA